MDISAVFAVGSFMMSEWVLKPKATVLVVLGCVLIYDLKTKTQDVVALRVYRGPALLAFTLYMTAYSLRTWRRNGVACDELLFLPGTSYGVTSGIDSYNPSSPVALQQESGYSISESNAATGIAVGSNRSLLSGQTEEMIPMVNSAEGIELATRESNNFHDTWSAADDSDGSADGSEKSGLSPGSQRKSSQATNEETQQLQHQQTNFQRFQENHPRITRIGTFFFFRGPNNATENATYAPSGPAVFGAGLDLSMPVVLNFHLFIQAYNRSMQDGDESTAKILPLIFLTILLVRSVIPPGRRRRFWSTVKFTAMAPFHRVRFRDAFVGDVMTSLVRPIQDVLFALAYYGTVIWVTVIGSHDLGEAGNILGRSWFLHNVILPSCAVLPLWWKFLQTLRQAYDANRRWPYYGDSFKYLSAAMIILYGMTHPEDRRSPWWLVSFVAATMYQICWDIFVDWELFVIAPRDNDSQSSDYEGSCCTRISSLHPNSYILLTLQMYFFQPILDGFRRLSAAIPNLGQVKFREKRLYKKDSFYHQCLLINILLRACWMLCFIPAYHFTLDSQRVTTFSSDVNSYFGVLLPLAELFRRCHWGFLKVEMETIRLMDTDVTYARVAMETEVNDGLADDHSTAEKERLTSALAILPTWLANEQKLHHQQTTTNSHQNRFIKICEFSESFIHRIFLLELTLWAVAFIGLGYWATY